MVGQQSIINEASKAGAVKMSRKMRLTKPIWYSFTENFPYSSNIHQIGLHQMAGVKGKSGGSRPNTGGARPGAGRKPNEIPLMEVSPSDDPKAFLISIMNDQEADARMRIDAAKCLMPFVHLKLGEGGKKEQKQDAAKVVASRFASAAPPKLIVNNR